MRNTSFTLDRRIPLSLLFALFLQASTAIWWASAKEAQDHFRDRRLAEIELRITGEGERQIEILERLARLETQGGETNAALRRIETRLSKPGR